MMVKSEIVPGVYKVKIELKGNCPIVSKINGDLFVRVEEIIKDDQYHVGGSAVITYVNQITLSPIKDSIIADLNELSKITVSQLYSF